MLHTWVRQTQQLFADIEQRLLAIDDASLFSQLAPPGKKGTLPHVWRTVLMFFNRMIASDELLVSRLEVLQNFLKVHFNKTDVSGFYVELKARNFYLMRTVESLGRLNLEDRETSTAVSYETLLLRLKCETLFPQFVKKMYGEFFLAESILDKNNQELAAKVAIKQYLQSNQFTSFTNVFLDYKDLAALLGNESVFSLFSKDEDSTFYDSLLTWAKTTHPILKIFNGKEDFGHHYPLDAMLDHIEMFSVLVAFPYSMHDRNLAKKILLPKTQQFLDQLTVGQYKFLKVINESVKEIVLKLWSLSMLGFEQVLSHSVLNDSLENILAKIFDVVFKGLLFQLTDEISIEFQTTLLTAIADFRLMVKSPQTAEPPQSPSKKFFWAKAATAESKPFIDLTDKAIEKLVELFAMKISHLMESTSPKAFTV